MTPDANAQAVTTQASRGAGGDDRVGERSYLALIGEQWRTRPTLRLVRLALALLPCLIALTFARASALGMTDQRSYYDPFTDAVTYLAAGERLNAGHELYALGPGDRPVALEPALSASPLFSPPPIAVLWRPLAAVPLGFALWTIATAVTILGTILYVAWRCGPVGWLLAMLLARMVGEEIAVSNVAAFFPALMIVAWRFRDRAGSGAIVALLGMLKLSPFTLAGWLVGQRLERPLVGFGAGVVAIAGVTTVGAGIAAWTAYAAIAATIGPSPDSLSGMTGIPWLSQAVLVAGTIAAALLGRWPGVSFAVAVAASVLGTPALGTSNLVPLLAMAAPLATRRTP